MTPEQERKIRKRILDPNNNAPSLQKLLAYRLLWAFMGKPAQIVPIDTPVHNNTLSPALPG